MSGQLLCDMFEEKKPANETIKSICGLVDTVIVVNLICSHHLHVQNSLDNGLNQIELYLFIN